MQVYEIIKNIRMAALDGDLEQVREFCAMLESTPQEVADNFAQRLELYLDTHCDVDWYRGGLIEAEKFGVFEGNHGFDLMENINGEIRFLGDIAVQRHQGEWKVVCEGKVIDDVRDYVKMREKYFRRENNGS